MKYLVAIFTALLLLLIVTTSARGESAAQSATCTSASSGNWSITTTWSCGHVPASTDEVVVNQAIALDTSATIRSLTVNGALTFDNNSATNHTLTVSGNVTINNGGIINISTSGPQRTHAFIVAGNFTNAGIFAGVSSKGNRVLNTTFNGTAWQTISGGGTTDFNDLTINSGTRVVFPATSVPTAEGTMTVNAGGAVQQTLTVNSGTVPFLQISDTANVAKYRGVELTPLVSALGITTMVITTTVNGGCTTTSTSSPAYATRCYEITPANNLSATVRLYALTATQLNSITQANLRVYRYAGSWQQLTTNASNGSASGGYSYAQADTPGFSDFLLGGPTGPTAVTLSTLNAQSPATISLLPIGLAVMAGAILLLIKRRVQ